jgi:hypothetical protein
MITMKEFMEIVDYKITEGDEYGWSCFGPNSYQLSSWNGVHGKGGYSFNIVFSTKTQKVYSVEVCDYTNDRAYRMINPKYKNKHDAEGSSRGVLGNQAWDDVNYTDLEVDDDFIQKCLSIKAGEKYDTRVQVPLTLDDGHMFELMKMAHERDLTLNQMVEEVLQEVINNQDLLKD